MYTELSMHVNDSVQDTMLSTWVSVGSFGVWQFCSWHKIENYDLCKYNNCL